MCSIYNPTTINRLIIDKETKDDWFPTIVDIKKGMKQFQSVLKPCNQGTINY